jgi:autotransporter adhesin
VARNVTVVGSAGRAVNGGISIQAGSIGTQDLAAGSVTFDRLDQGVQNRITGLESGLKTANAGIAMSFAMSNLPQLSDPSSNFAFGIGLGTFEGQSAIAMGGTARLTDRAVMRASVSSAGGKVGAGVGVGFSF